MHSDFFEKPYSLSALNPLNSLLDSHSNEAFDCKAR